MDKHDIVFPSIVQKRNIMRFLQGNNYKVKATIDEIKSHLEWRKQNLPIYINEPAKQLLDNGYLYVYGRDRYFRPGIYHNPKVFKVVKPPEEDALVAVHFVMQYVVNFSKYINLYIIISLIVRLIKIIISTFDYFHNHLIVVTINGQVENWTSFIDLDKMSVGDIPKRRVMRFVNSNKMVYKCRAYKAYVLNTTSGLLFLYKLFSPFIDERVKQ